MEQLIIVMYHFVRELPYTRYPKIKGLLTSEFKNQLAYMQRHYQFITMEDCIQALYSKDASNFPKNAILLTFDDGYIEHFTTVFPILEEKKIQGCFFPPAKAILGYNVLDVNKIHFLLATTNPEFLIQDIDGYLNQYRSLYALESNDYYFSKLAHHSRFDSKEIVFIKRLLQAELDETLRHLIIAELFNKYVTKDEKAFSRELYMNSDQLKCMIRNGMYVGSHGYDHYFLNLLSPEQQEHEIDLSLQFLKNIGSPTQNWAMCYPYGAYNNSLIHLLKSKSCKLGLTTKASITNLCKDNAFTMERLDTNDFPKIAHAEMSAWTKKLRGHEQQLI